MADIDKPKPKRVPFAPPGTALASLIERVRLADGSEVVRRLPRLQWFLDFANADRPGVEWPPDLFPVTDYPSTDRERTGMDELRRVFRAQLSLIVEMHAPSGQIVRMDTAKDASLLGEARVQRVQTLLSPGLNDLIDFAGARGRFLTQCPQCSRFRIGTARATFCDSTCSTAARGSRADYQKKLRDQKKRQETQKAHFRLLTQTRAKMVAIQKRIDQHTDSPADRARLAVLQTYEATLNARLGETSKASK